jgi:hypothetical protein
MRFPDTPRDLGLVTTAEALLPRERGGLELTQRALRWRVDSGRWQRLHNGVYLMGSGRVDWPTRAAAALLAYGDAAALCDRSAGFLQGLVSEPGDVIHVLVPRAARPHHHTGTRLHRSDRRRVISVWPARTAYETTVLDLATSPRADDLAGLLATALRGRRTTEARLALALKGFRTHPQRRLLTDLLGASAAGSVGALEVRFGRDVLRRHGLPEGVGQFPAAEVGQFRAAEVSQFPAAEVGQTPIRLGTDATVDGLGRTPRRGQVPASTDRRRFDRAIPELRILVELDGTLYHQGSRRAADRRKANLASRHDWLLLRYGWIETVDEACLTAAEILEVALERGWRGEARGCQPGCPVARVMARRAG